MDSNEKIIESLSSPTKRILIPTIVLGAIGGAFGLVSKQRRLLGVGRSCATNTTNAATVTGSYCGAIGGAFGLVSKHRRFLGAGRSCATYTSHAATVTGYCGARDLVKAVQKKEILNRARKMLPQMKPYFSSASRTRLLSSFSSLGAFNLVIIKSEQEFCTSLKKVEDDCLSAVFYFTADWCGPCKLIYPIITNLTNKYPHVATFEVDIDQEDVQDILGELDIMEVPTFLFLQNGKLVQRMIGADVARLNNFLESLYSTKINKPVS